MQQFNNTSHPVRGSSPSPLGRSKKGFITLTPHRLAKNRSKNISQDEEKYSEKEPFGDYSMKIRSKE